jgi:sec-independent protein translocase protein TatC
VKEPGAEMSFFSHLEELRWRLVKIAVALLVCFVPCWIFWRQIFDVVMVYPLQFADPKPHLIFTSPVEAVLLSFKIAFGAGFVLAAPVIFYQIWKFIAPGLYPKEKKLVMPTVVASTVAFLSGILFCYFLLPFLFKVLTSYAGSRLDPFFKIDEYFSFLLKLSIAFGLVFELPVVSFVLARVGVLKAEFLLRHARIAIVVIFVIAAILTPPDIFSQMALAVPLLALYGISILVARFAGRKQ